MTATGLRNCSTEFDQISSVRGHYSPAAKHTGYNSSGQLGDNSTAGPRTVPTDVSNQSTNVAQVATGLNHSCALGSGGAVQCWGDGFFGQLGDNSTTGRLVATDVLGLNSGITQVAAGAYHSCAVSSAGAAQCWGRNSLGQLGDNSVTQKNVATNVIGLSSGIAQIAAGEYHTCALSSAGAVKC